MKKKKLNYTKRSDLEKVKSNWSKAKGLYEREEWSTVILRIVTAVELTANFVIRQELQINKNLDSEFVNHLLLWANGINGKFNKLIIPIYKGTKFEKDLKKINKKVQYINRERNTIAHSGQFKNKSTAKKIVIESEKIIETLVAKFEKDFVLEIFSSI